MNHRLYKGSEWVFEQIFYEFDYLNIATKNLQQLDASLPANPLNDWRIANAVTLKSTFCLP